jgi:hypothetical protein
MNNKGLSYPELQPNLVTLLFIDIELFKVAFNIANQKTMVE